MSVKDVTRCGPFDLAICNKPQVGNFWWRLILKDLRPGAPWKAYLVTVPNDCVLEAMAPIPEGWKLDLGDQHDPSECGIPNSSLNGFCHCVVPAHMCDPALFAALSTVNSNCAFL